ncbi:MAG TPA: aminotransferase class III-fold pyridoxal phosphate-dependent enzyme [Streptosporangiaceae bacterium]|nr:aminotransferase class III-fold pyridoxal phosphate-dependent enzyme [Streptosporangiaceae bacterium]
MAVQAATESSTNSATLSEIIEEQERIFSARQPESRRLAELAAGSLAGGVTSSWQITRPQPVWLSHGQGSKIYDVDGNEYVDLHGGYGAGLAGHGHPAVVTAVREQVGLGTHFAQPTRAAIAVAQELSRRFGLPQWRFANSGTEATMDAVHLMRAITGRDLIIKVEGCYHGHHDSVQVSVCPEDDADLGPAGRPRPVPSSSGIPRAITDLTLIAGFNDLAAVEALLTEHPGQVAGMIIEPIMMNAGIIQPRPGYLAGLKDLLHAHGALLTFDEVKTGLTAGPGGATGVTGVSADIVCLAKAIGGGVAVAAVGGTAAVMAHVTSGDYEMVGTFNGNPLAMAAARAMLTEVVTPEAYERIGRLRRLAVEGLEREIARNGLQARVVAVGAKGCVEFSAEPVRDFRGFRGIEDSYSHAHWLFQHNGGVFLPPWGKTEQWLISVQHDEADIQRFVLNFASFAAAVGPAKAA